MKLLPRQDRLNAECGLRIAEWKKKIRKAMLVTLRIRNPHSAFRIQMFRNPQSAFRIFLLAFGLVSSGFGQDSGDQMNFGREAREGTPIIDRDPNRPLDERERIHHVLSRFTFGATSEMIDLVGRIGLEKWFESQLAGDLDESSVLRSYLEKLVSLDLTNQEILEKYRLERPSLKKKLTREEMKLRRELQALQYVPRKQLKDAVLIRAAFSNHQVLEVASDFWRNHFSIDVSKGNCRYFATEYEREVIRGEALGSFAAMFNKQARAPAMLMFLDNYISRGTPQEQLLRTLRYVLAYTGGDLNYTEEAVALERMKGLNENYGRELMELHTLGVDNYYTQDDVLLLSEAITGWTFQQNPEKGPIAFMFRPDMHATGARTILRKKIPAYPSDPIREGQAALDLLVDHPGTAKFIAYKLCRYFVGDSPPKDLVKKVEVLYRRKKTDLKTLYRAIFEDEEFYDPKYYQAKFKRPFEFVASALRVTDAQITSYYSNITKEEELSTQDLHRKLMLMSEPIYQCEDPTGFYDQADAWRDPGAMAPRWRFGIGLGMGWIRGVKIPDSYWEELEPNNPLQWKEVITKRILPGGCTAKTSGALDRVIEKYAVHNPRPDQLGRYIVGILIGSPEFQRQ